MARTPSQTFWSDQALATARDMAADGQTFAIVHDYADGEQCSWCDCTVADFQGHRCGGCTEQAETVVRVYNGTPVRRDIPICAGHRDDAIAFMVRHMAGSG
ncbi:hypothetical protein [Streptomyces chartreusis]|uniref:hypothetical protein n=1 Tax=Streptomyces chartreusis TaxID=1969 RepID=UPI00381BBA87